MRIRLQTLLGKDRVGELQMGTFHSLCAKFLRKYAHTIGLSDNFSICDADDAYVETVVLNGFDSTELNVS
jgi:DNA helicase-2/ATP-dependent DNA helicase PcrA